MLLEKGWYMKIGQWVWLECFKSWFITAFHSESVRCRFGKRRFSKCRFSAELEKLEKYARWGAASKKKNQKPGASIFTLSPCGNRCRFVESQKAREGCRRCWRIIHSFYWRHEMLSLPRFGHFLVRKMAAGKSAPPSGTLLDFLLWDRHRLLEFFFWENAIFSSQVYPQRKLNGTKYSNTKVVSGYGGIWHFPPIVRDPRRHINI